MILLLKIAFLPFNLRKWTINNICLLEKVALLEVVQEPIGPAPALFIYLHVSLDHGSC